MKTKFLTLALLAALAACNRAPANNVATGNASAASTANLNTNRDASTRKTECMISASSRRAPR